MGFDLECRENYPLCVGDRVVYSKFAGVEFSYDDGHRVLMVAEEDVLGIVGGEVTIEPDTERMVAQPK